MSKSFSVKTFDAATLDNEAFDAATLALVALHSDAEYDNFVFDAESIALESAYDEAQIDNEAFDAMRATIDANALQSANSVDSLDSYMQALIDAVDARKRYEIEKNAENDSMLAKLKSFRTSVAIKRIASIMQSANVDSNLLNRQERINARFNEKAYVKVLNIAHSLDSSATLNIYTRAILKSIQQFEQNEMLMTQAETKLACSAHNRIANVNRNSCLIRTNKIYDASTCSTQASSTNNALQAYNIIIETRDAQNVACFKLNRDNALTERLLALC